jgi:sulfur carrier protein ThiS
MSTVSVHFVGPVRRPCPERTLEVDASELSTVGELLAELGYSDEEQRSLQPRVDGKRARASMPLTGVQTVEILIAIGGG